MTIVNKFNVNNKQVTLDADIIENMSANDVSYDTSTQYDENTVGDKLSELSQQGQQVIYDVTANNDGITFSSLSELLSSENLSTLIPTSVRHGGMSILFVQSSDNKYVQYRLLTQSFSINENDWLGLRKNPNKSCNLFDKYAVVHGYYGSDGITYQESDTYWCSDFIEVEEGQLYERTGFKSLFVYAYDIDRQPVVVENNHVYWQGNFESTPIPSGVKYIRVLFAPSNINVEMVYNQNSRPNEYVPYTAPFILDNKIDVNIPNATKNQAGLFAADDKKKLDNLNTYSLSIFTYEAKTAFTLDYTAKTLSVNNVRLLIIGGKQILVNRINAETYITEFVGNGAAPERVAFIIFHKEDNKLYLVDFDSVSSYPEYNAEGNIVNIYIGPINRMYANSTWTIGFNFGHIVINGKDYYGNYTPDSVFPITREKMQGVFPITSVDTDFIEKVIIGINLFNKYAVVHGYYESNGITYTPSNTFWCSDFIEVEEGQKYRRALKLNYYVYAYDIDKQPVVVENNHVYWQGNFESTPIPSDVKYIRVVVSPDDIDTQMVYNQNLHPSEYVPYFYFLLSPDIHVNLPETDDYTSISNNIGTSDVGNLSYQEIDEADYSQIIMYGQSLSMGWEAPEAISEDAIPGVFMIGDKVSIGHGNNGQNVLNPLISTKATSCGENPTVGAMNAFAKLYKRFVSKEQKFIATSCGEGGKSIEQLSKECTNGTNYYNTQFITTLTRTKTTVDALNKTVGCFAILFMQGEYNYVNLPNGGLTPGTDATNDKDTYKQYLLTLKNNMQADIMAQYGQAKKPLFLLYEVAGSYINLKNMSINMAQIEFAQENDDVFILAPTYPVPDYGGGHLSTNGYRWYGEMMAKSLYNIFIKGLAFYSIMPEKFEIVNDKTVRIDFHVPVLPLVFDTYTKESIQDYGFRIFVDDTDTAILSLNVKNNSVIITTGTSLTNKKVELTYAGQGRSGSGNLRDCDTYHSLYNYYDDRETSPSKRENYTPKDKNGNYIYGKPYPMFNWCGNFYKLVQDSNN